MLQRRESQTSDEDDEEDDPTSEGGDSEEWNPHVEDALLWREELKKRRRRSDDNDDEDYVPPLTLNRELEKHIIEGHRLRQRIPRRAKQTLGSPVRKRRKTIEAPPFKIDTWAQLLDLTRKTAALPQDTMYRDCASLPALLAPLEEIETLVGLEDIKQALTDYVVYYTQIGKLLKKPRMNHMVITGPSGCGKTTLARAIAKLFARMGLLKSDRVVHASRSSLVGEYLGSTAIKTQKVINSALGAVLLIDEAYSVGGGGNEGDCYALECVNTINQNLTENGDKFLLIMAGYKESLEANVFALNEGLARRFQWRFDLPAASPAQLSGIFRKMIAEEDLKLEGSVGEVKWFEQHKERFPQSGGSVENLVSKVKIAHAKRVFGEAEAKKGVVSLVDLNTGFKLYQKFEQSQGEHDKDRHMHTIYN